MRATFYPLSMTIIALVTPLVFNSLPFELSLPDNDDELVPQAQAIEKVSLARMESVETMLDGKASLARTAARFRDLAADLPRDGKSWLRMIFPTASDRELHFRHVLLYAETNCRVRRLDPGCLQSLQREMDDRELSDDWTFEEVDDSDG